MKAELPPDPAARIEDQAEDINLITYLLARFEVDETSGKLSEYKSFSSDICV
jgi:hypothetical protein